MTGPRFAHGPHLLAIPGPTTVPDVVLQAMHRPAIDIYDGDLLAITDRLLKDLRTVFRTVEGRAYIFASNGHGAWEASLCNTLSRGDQVLVCESGRFAVAWGETAAEMGCVVEVLPGDRRGAIDPNALEDRLRADRAGAIKAVLAAHIDTASSVTNDVQDLRRAIDAAGHPALFMVDGVASIGCAPFEMDAWGVDVAMTGSQKGLMTPPGLSFMAMGPKARARRASADLATRYWDVEFREGAEHYQKYCGTPPEHLLFGLDRALQLLLREEGLEASWARHAALAAAVHEAVATWAEGGDLDFLIEEPRSRSVTVTTVQTRDGRDAAALRRLCTETFGATVGAAIGGVCRPDGFRVAHMGHASGASVLGVLGAVEAAMGALGWTPVKGGASAAAAHLAEAVRP